MKKKLVAIFLVVAMLTALLAGCGIFTKDAGRDYHQAIAKVSYNGMTSEIYKGEVQRYFIAQGGTYISQGASVEQTVEYLYTNIARQKLMAMYSVENIAQSLGLSSMLTGNFEDIDVSKLLTVDEKRYCIEKANKTFNDLLESNIAEYEEEDAANSKDDKDEDEDTDKEDELPARTQRPSDNESEDYEDKGLTDESQLPEYFTSSILKKIAEEQDKTTRNYMQRALRDINSTIEGNYSSYEMILREEHLARILQKFRDTKKPTTISDEEVNNRLQKLTSDNIASFIDEAAYSSAVGTSTITYHKAQGYTLVKSILLKFSDAQSTNLTTLKSMVNTATALKYREDMVFGNKSTTDVTVNALIGDGLKINVSNPDYDADEDELVNAYTDKDVNLITVLVAMAEDIANKVDAITGVIPATYSDAEKALVKQYATEQAFVDWLYLVNDDTGMFSSANYTVTPEGKDSSYVEEYTVLARELAKQAVGSYSIDNPTDSVFKTGTAEYTGETGILQKANGVGYTIYQEEKTTTDSTGKESKTTVYTLRTANSNDISFIINDYGVHIVLLTDKVLDDAKGKITEVEEGGETVAWTTGLDYRHSYEVDVTYAEDGVTPTSLELTVKTFKDYITETLIEEMGTNNYNLEYTVFMTQKYEESVSQIERIYKQVLKYSTNLVG